MRYLTLSELIYINGRVLDNPAIMSGQQKVRDWELAEAAAQRPAASAFGQDAYPTLPEKLAALLHAIARNHPFTDGNKRTATVAVLLMAEVNGWRVVWQPATALEMILDVAEGRREWRAFADWLVLRDSEARAPEADAERDAAHIARLIEEHRWLLQELALR